jgi:hypothetical protein
MSATELGKNKSGSQKYCILLNSTSSASRRQVATSVDRAAPVTISIVRAKARPPW